MENIFVELLPPWIETGLQPAFYDKESGTVLQQTARMYAKVNELTQAFNNFSTNTTNVVNDYINRFNTLHQEFIDLHDYVYEYFDNLDVQDEINNKLDAMVEDGTMSSLIDPILDQFEEEVRTEVAKIGDLTKLQTVNKATIVDGVNSANQNYIGLLREKYGNNYSPVDVYEGVDFFSENVVIYKDRFTNNYACYCDTDKHKNTGGTTLYVDCKTDVPSAEQDGTESKPYDTVSKAYSHSSNGDTIAVASGFYSRFDTGNFNFSKSVNIVAKEGKPNKVFFGSCDNLTWTVNESYTNVYETTRSNTIRVIDIRNKDKDCLPELTRVDQLSTCATTLNSYAIDGSIVYVNIGEPVTDDNTRCLVSVTSPFRIINDNDDTNVYLENITFIGGSEGFVRITGSGSYDCLVTAVNCNFYYASGNSYDAISVLGANTIFVNCKACFSSHKDGFNYHLSGSRHPRNIEINCVGANNGLERTDASTSNGSTAHAQVNILRFNCVYFNNNGSNMCDVGTGNLSVNIMCKSFDSASVANTNINRNDFSTQDDGSIMKLYNCYAKGSNSRVNIYAHANSTVDVYNCFYDNAVGSGDGTLIIH